VLVLRLLSNAFKCRTTLPSTSASELSKTVKNWTKDLIGEIYSLTRSSEPCLGNRLLMYHAIDETLEHDPYGMTVAKQSFTEQMKYLVDHYSVIPVRQIVASNELAGTVSISFDDGYQNNLKAVEVLEKMNLPYTIYIATAFIDRPTYLTRSDITQLVTSPLCTIGAHGHRHLRFSSLSDETKREELVCSKAILEDICQTSVTQLSYPFGSFDESTQQLAQSLGYLTAATSIYGLNTTQHLKALELRRTEITTYDTMRRFTKKMRGNYDFLSYR
jgi:peptidoglycan/xylan/chitin deacetylase (PgdA/CDA1 family)